MDTDDPRISLLGRASGGRMRRAAANLCSLQSWRRRVPITIWLPKYTWECFLRDAIAGITVGLTSIPQGIAYAMVAGLPPQVGLYSSIFPGVVYAVLGSCKDVTVGPTAVLAALLAKYVAKSPDFAYLAAFLSGGVILLLGVLQLGFLLDFISKPVISGFTTAAALQISASQLKALFTIQGSSGSTFVDAVVNFCRHIHTVQLWDTVLGLVTIVALLLLKRASAAAACGPGASGARRAAAAACVYGVRARNALVVFAGALLAYCLHLYGISPFALTGKIEGGLPNFGPPPFSTTVGNETLGFEDMLSVFGPEGLVLPLVAILESIAIAKAFAGGAAVDATQEMVALGAANMVSSLCQCMPTTGSFTRTALNHASGVLTPAGSLFKASLVLLSVTLLSEAFYFIPRPTLAAIILVAMASIIELGIVKILWKNSKPELAVWLVTVCAGAGAGLEYGVAGGALADLLRPLARAARPPPPRHDLFKVGNVSCVVVTLAGALWSGGGGRLAGGLRRACGGQPEDCGGPRGPAAAVLLLDGRLLAGLDLGVAESIISVVEELQSRGQVCLFWNVQPGHRRLLQAAGPRAGLRFVSGATAEQHVAALELPR